MKVSIVVPVYNEFRTFPLVLARIEQAALPPGCTRSARASDGRPVPQAASRMILRGAAPLASQNQRVMEANTTAFQSCHFSQPLR